MKGFQHTLTPYEQAPCTHLTLLLLSKPLVLSSTVLQMLTVSHPGKLESNIKIQSLQLLWLERWHWSFFPPSFCCLLLIFFYPLGLASGSKNNVSHSLMANMRQNIYIYFFFSHFYIQVIYLITFPGSRLPVFYFDLLIILTAILTVNSFGDFIPDELTYSYPLSSYPAAVL